MSAVDQLEILQQQSRFAVKQRITVMVNRYEIQALDGSEGALLALAQQKRMAWKEQVTFYTDDDRTVPLFGFKARQRIDLGATFDVTDAEGTPIGEFKKAFAKSLFRSTWQMSDRRVAGVTGRERNPWVAVLRRVWSMIPFLDYLPFAWPYHFDFEVDGRPVMSVVKKFGLRDRYTVTVHEPELDRRVAAAMAVALDALQSR